MTTIGWTGHRLQKLPSNTDILKSKMRTELLMLKPDKCITGMAQGVDMFAAQICVEEKIPFIAAIPFIGQEKLWPDHIRKEYDYLTKKAKDIVIVSEGGFTTEKMQIRNEYIVDNCDNLIAVYSGIKGGTRNCILYAIKKNRNIIYISPH